MPALAALDIKSPDGYVQYPGSLTNDTKMILLDAAHLVSIAYDDSSTIRRQWQRLHGGAGGMPNVSNNVLSKLSDLVFVNDHSLDVQAFAGFYSANDSASNDMLIVAIRGTNSITDWLLNFKFVLVDFGEDSSGDIVANAKVHHGFRMQYTAVVKVLGEKIRDHLLGGGNVLFTGHSLGAAVSTILALRFAKQFPQQIWNATYGSPRVGNTVFAECCKRYLGMCWRVKNCSDPICAIILPVLGQFEHVGNEVHLGERDFLPNIPIMSSVADHAHWNYIKNLSEVGSAPPAGEPKLLCDLMREIVIASEITSVG